MLLLRRSEFRVVRLLRARTDFEGLSLLERWSLRRLVRNGAATLLDGGRYALIPDGYTAFRKRRRLRALLVVTLLVVALLLLWWRGTFA